MLPSLRRQLRLEQLEQRALLAGDIIFSNSGSMHAIAILPIGWTDEDWLAADRSLPVEALPMETTQAPSEPGSEPEQLSSEEPAPVVEPSTPSAAQAAIRLEVTDRNGQPIDSISVGESFRLRVYVQDLRSYKAGIFYAAIDTEFDAKLADLAESIDLAPANVRTDRSRHGTGLLDDVGGVLSLDFYNGPEALLFTAEMTALSAGELTFTTNPGEVVGGFLLQFGRGTYVTAEEVNFGTAKLQITDASTSAGGEGFNWCPVSVYASTKVPLPPGLQNETVDTAIFVLSTMPSESPFPTIAQAVDSVFVDDLALNDVEQLVALDFLFPRDKES